MLPNYRHEFRSHVVDVLRRQWSKHLVRESALAVREESVHAQTHPDTKDSGGCFFSSFAAHPYCGFGKCLKPSRKSVALRGLGMVHKDCGRCLPDIECFQN